MPNIRASGYLGQTVSLHTSYCTRFMRSLSLLALVLFCAPSLSAQTLEEPPVVDLSASSCLYDVSEADSADYLVVSETKRIVQVNGRTQTWTGNRTVCGPMERGKDFLGPTYMTVSDTLKVFLRDLDALNYNGEHLRRTADGKHLSKRTAQGRLDTYRVVETTYQLATTDPVGGSVLIPESIVSSEVNYYAVPDGRPFKPTYDALSPIVSDTPASRDWLDQYRRKRRTGLLIQGLALVVIAAGVAVSVDGATGEGLPAAGIGIVVGGAAMSGIGYGISIGARKHLTDAVDAYLLEEADEPRL